MTPDLSRRLADAMHIGAATLAQRLRIMAAAQHARTFADLPDDVRELVLRLESR